MVLVPDTLVLWCDPYGETSLQVVTFFNKNKGDALQKLKPEDLARAIAENTGIAEQPLIPESSTSFGLVSKPATRVGGMRELDVWCRRLRAGSAACFLAGRGAATSRTRT
jgi:hypothetical protein